MQPREFLRLVVEPNLADADTDIADVRRTYNAIMAVDALAAHIFHWCRHHNSQYVKGIADDNWYRIECGKNREYVRMLHDLAKASKHVELTKGSPTIRTFANMQPREFGYGEGGYGIGPYGGSEQVSVSVNGSKVQIAMLLLHALDFYRSEMDAAGIPA